MTRRIVVYTDGAARGNPGPAAIGAVLYDIVGDVLEPIAEVSDPIGEATNNVAEYRAVIAGLEEADRLGADEVVLRADSQLLVRQLTGQYRVKSAHLKPLYRRARERLGRFERTFVEHVPREANTAADALANAALDQ